MSGPPLNLAAKPFVNERPVRRLAVLLWSMGGILLLVNGLLFGQYLIGSVEGRDRVRGLRAEVQKERQVIADLSQTLVTFDLEEQNEQVEFLNQKIDERMFPWGLLFERLGDVLPADVRLSSLAPHTEDARRRRRTRRDRDDNGSPRVELRMTGAAKNGEALLAVLDALFEHPSFEEPDLLGEHREASNEVRFELNVEYLPYDTGGEPTEVTATTAASDVVHDQKSGGEGVAGAPNDPASAAAVGPNVAVEDTVADAGSLPRAPRSEGPAAGGVVAGGVAVEEEQDGDNERAARTEEAESRPIPRVPVGAAGGGADRASVPASHLPTGAGRRTPPGATPLGQTRPVQRMPNASSPPGRN